MGALNREMAGVKAVFRVLGFGFAVIAFVLLVIDGTGMIASKSYGLTATADVLARFTETGTLERWQAALSRIHPFLWSGVSTILLAVPAVALATVLSLLFWLVGRRNEPEWMIRPPA
jgi:ABC-type glycerol-3-phosphate transport system permease component